MRHEQYPIQDVGEFFANVLFMVLNVSFHIGWRLPLEMFHHFRRFQNERKRHVFRVVELFPVAGIAEGDDPFGKVFDVVHGFLNGNISTILTVCLENANGWVSMSETNRFVMIVYSSTKKGFISDVETNNIEDILQDNLLAVMKRHVTKSEYMSWQNSLKEMFFVLNKSEVPDDAGLSIEFNIP